ncbi:tyrosine-type recombinase/integrase [Tardiphaga robiniae]|uniref:Tyrosine-type recombinase/integrase n=2 Tax=Tardiphaga robiniae TaxID=943830 RepID=A0A7G6U4R2_9BRAD|nr:tyrosine-type recombinase/integrase [Tardiphaga robiniae]
MRRQSSRYPLFVQRIPADVREKAVGNPLAIPLGDGFVFVTPSGIAQAIRFSLRTADPSEIKTRQAVAAAFLEGVWAALRDDAPTKLSHKQATALAGELYRAWADSEGRAQSVAMEHVPGIGWKRVEETQDELEVYWEAVVLMWEKVRQAADDPKRLEKQLGPLVDRLLLTKGISKVDSESRGFLLSAFWMALRDAFRGRQLQAGGNYAEDPSAEKYPEWQSQQTAKPKTKQGSAKNSLTTLVEDWWKEAKAAGRKQSTYESYRNTMAKLVAFLKHDSVSRVTPEDIVRFKDHRLANGASAKTVKDSDLAGLKTIFGWAKMNRRAAIDPVAGLTIKAPKPRKLRQKGFYDDEASAILKHAKNYVPGNEAPKLAAAKRFVPGLCAFTGARVGEMLQLRKQDVRREGKHWILHITPEAGTVKTDEARDVVLHQQVIEGGFLDFYEAAKPGHLFISPKDGELGIRNALKTARNKVTEFVREVVPDKNVDPSHGWRHRFKTVGIDLEIEMRVLDALQGHAPTNVSGEYGEVSIKAKANAIAKFPHIAV